MRKLCVRQAKYRTFERIKKTRLLELMNTDVRYLNNILTRDWKRYFVMYINKCSI